jgi:excisionase family DNA binding protein
MAKFVSLEEAARLLGMTPEQLVEARDRNEIHGYRDGTSWKFKMDEVERYRQEKSGGGSAEGGSDLLGDDDEDLVLVTEEPVLQSPSTVIGASGQKPSADSDIQLAGSDDLLAGSDLLASGTPSPQSSSDSDVHLIVNGASSDVKVAPGSSAALGAVPSSDLELDLGKPSSTGTGELGSGSDELAVDTDALSLSDEEELVLAGSGTGSDVGLGSDTGINLASPSDSGISLDDEPIELGAVSSLELPEDEEPVVAEEGSLEAEDEFKLEPLPVEPVEEESSGSQIIELETPTLEEAAPIEAEIAPEIAPAVTAPAVEYPVVLPGPSYSIYNILFLFCIVGVLSLSGILMVDVTRNMWSWNEKTERSAASMIMETLLNALKLQ